MSRLTAGEALLEAVAIVTVWAAVVLCFCVLPVLAGVALVQAVLA